MFWSGKFQHRSFRHAVAAGCGVACGLTAFNATAQTLSQELTQLIQTHPRILAARKNVREANEAIGEAFSEFLPTVTLTGDAGYEHTDSPERRRDDKDELTTWRQRGTVTVTQNLYDGSRKTANLDIANLNVGVSQAELNL